MTDTPDLHTLAAEAMRGNTVRTFQEAADAVLAAVLPAHRRQVLAEAADHLLWVADAQSSWLWLELGESVLMKVAAHLRRLASAAPETAPSPRQDDETAPAVGREAAEAQGQAETDEAPWRVGSHYGIHLYRQAGAKPGDDDEPIGTMFRPELAAQVVAEHRHAVEYRAMLRGAGQRFAKRGLEGRRDDTAALAARLGFVPAAEAETARAGTQTVIDELNRTGTALKRVSAERNRLQLFVNVIDRIALENADRDSPPVVSALVAENVDLRQRLKVTSDECNDKANALHRVRALADDIAGGPERGSVLANRIRAALGTADSPPIPPNTDPKAGDDQ